MRESLKQRLIAIAKEWAKEATCIRKQVGGVLTIDGRIIASGYNGSPSGLPHCTGLETCPVMINGRQTCNKTLHCEKAIISFCARKGIATDNSILFITLSPCEECAKILINAGVKAVYYIEEYNGPTGTPMLESANIPCIKVEENPGLVREF